MHFVDNDAHFIMEFLNVLKRAGETTYTQMVAKGFHKSHQQMRVDGYGVQSDITQMALVMTEVCEGIEGVRKGNGPSDHIPDFNCAEEEYADAVIRILDHCAARNWRLGEAIVAKMHFNANREFMHGKKV